MDPVIAVATAIITLLGAWFAVKQFVLPIIRGIKRLMESTEKFLEDWNGSEPSPGRDRVPGVMERLNRIDGELSHNGGKSIKDVVNRIEDRLVEGDKKFDELYSRVQKLERRRKSNND